MSISGFFPTFTENFGKDCLPFSFHPESLHHPPWWSTTQTSQLLDKSDLNFISTLFQLSLSVVTTVMALPPKPNTESTLWTTRLSTSPTPYVPWIFPWTPSRPWIYQASHLCPKSTMSLSPSPLLLPRKSSMDSETSMTLASALHSPIP